MIKRNDIARRVDLPCVGMPCGVDIVKGVVAGPIGAGGLAIRSDIG